MNTIFHKNNFDSLRLFASVIVILAHCYPLKGLGYKYEPLFYVTHCNDFGHLGVSIFLCISGYLICHSLTINSNFIFFYKRLLRIIPPLIIVVFLTIFILGPVYTSFLLNDYFGSSQTYLYFLNITLFRMQYTIPGVFDNLPFKGVINGSLWTLSYEFFFYIILFVQFAILRRTNLVVIGSTIILILIYCFFNNNISINKYVIPFLNLSLQSLLDLGIYFYIGASVFIIAKKLSQRIVFILFIFALILFFVCVITKSESNDYLFYFITPVFTFSIALNHKINLQKLTSMGDFSYGIYIFAFPLQQILISITHNEISVPLLFFSTAILAYIFGGLSWHMIELKAMKYKNAFSYKKITNREVIK